jgi:riboflavin biosynthesis pyrimidine reductase
VIVRRIFPEAGEPIEIDSADARERLAPLYDLAGESWVRVNLVSSVNGSAAGQDGTSESLTNRVDRKILGVIRRSSEVVLIGAASVRAEGYRLPRTAPLAIVTSSGDLGAHELELATDRAVPLVLCPASASDRARASLVGADIVIVADDDGRMTAAGIIQALHDRGLRRIVCEGPSLAGLLLDAGLVNEFCLSTSPSIGGVSQPLLGSAPVASKRLELRQLLADESSTIYARWTVIA